MTQLPQSPEALAALAAQSRTCYYPENSAGLTYGSSALAGAVGHQPDLIAVITTDGQNGYARREDLDGPVVRTPEEAAAHMRAQEAGLTLIPVYDLDGLEIGQFLCD